MGILNRILPYKIIKRASIDDPNYWPNIFGKLFGIQSKTKINVTQDSALQQAAVYACIRVLSETIASLPLMVYKKLPNGGKEPAPKHDLYPILHDSPNRWQTSFEHREMYVGHLNLIGNSYDFITRNGADKIIELMPMNPNNMEVKLSEDKKKLIYIYTFEEGKQEKYSQEEIWHKKGLSNDGYVGLSPITIAREAIGIAIATDEYGAKYFANDAKPGGILTVPGRMKPDARDRFKSQWQAAFTGDNRWQVAVLEEGLDWKAIGIPNDDSQFIEAKNFNVEEIARIYRVPTVLLQHPDKTSTHASAEQFFLSFVVHSIRPWLVRLEQSMNKALLSEKDRKDGYFCEHKVDGLLRGDIKARYESYAIGIQNKWLNANEVRALENMNPREGGEIYENPNISINKNEEKDGKANI